MFRSRAVAALCAAFVAIAIVFSTSSTRAAESGVPAQANDFIRYLAFVGAAPLAPSDQARITAETRAQLASNSAGVERADAAVRKLLAALPQAQDWQRADYRESARLQLEMQPASDPIRQIVDRTDPVVVFERAHKRLVTQGTLAAWQRACRWMAGMLSVPGPSTNFFAAERAFLKTSYAALPQTEQDQIAHVERNYPISVLLIEHADPTRRAEFIRQARPLAQDRKQFALLLAQVMAQTYDVALQRLIVHESIVHAGLLNSGLLMNGAYRTMYAHAAGRY